MGFRGKIIRISRHGRMLVFCELCGREFDRK